MVFNIENKSCLVLQQYGGAILALWENSPLHNKALQCLRVAPEDCKNG